MVDDALEEVFDVFVEELRLRRMARPTLPNFHRVIRGQLDQRIPLQAKEIGYSFIGFEA